MITPYDNDYKETRQIMLGKASMKPEFRELADWIDRTYGVRTINIIYDTIENDKKPRLEICFEHQHEKLKFLNNDRFSYDPGKQKVIAEMFKKTLQKNRFLKNWGVFNFLKQGASNQFQTDNLLVIYGAFEPIGRIEANENIPESNIAELKKALNNNALWEISRCFATVTFFLYTDIQVKEYENSNYRKVWANSYFDLLEPYDEFGYFNRDSFSILLDSKENFDNNFESNWHYYYK